MMSSISSSAGEDVAEEEQEFARENDETVGERGAAAPPSAWGASVMDGVAAVPVRDWASGTAGGDEAPVALPDASFRFASCLPLRDARDAWRWTNIRRLLGRRRFGRFFPPPRE